MNKPTPHTLSDEQMPEMFSSFILKHFQSFSEYIKKAEELRQSEESKHLMMVTCAIESTTPVRNEDGSCSVKHIPNFYFCTSNGLTIGFGSKIEFKDGELAPEGRELLQHIRLTRNGRELTEAEKEEVVKDCFKRRNKRDALINKGKKAPELTAPNGKKIPQDSYTKNMTPEAQSVILHDCPVPVIDRESALDAIHFEYNDKLNRLVAKVPHFGESLFLKALATDFAFQDGMTGIQENRFYKLARDKNKTSSSLNFGGKTDDRSKMRQLLCKMAYKTHVDKQNRKGTRATPESQAVFYIEALQAFTEEFSSDIKSNYGHKKALMEHFMTIVGMQCMENIKGAPLTPEEMKQAQQQAHQLVFEEIFNSKIIAQLPKEIQNATRLAALQSISTEGLKSNTENAAQAVRRSILETAGTKLTDYNKKHDTNFQLNLSPEKIS